MGEQMIELIHDVFEDILINKKDVKKWFDIKKSTFEEIKVNKKQVLCFASHHLYKGNKILTENYLLKKGVFMDVNVVQNFWPNTDNPVLMYKRISHHLNSLNKDKEVLNIT